MFFVLLQSERDKFIRVQQQDQEESLAKELESLKLEKNRDEKMRQQVRECRCVEFLDFNL
jgi:hypothetical protein